MSISPTRIKLPEGKDSVYHLKDHMLGFPGGLVAKNLPANAGEMDLIPDPKRPHMP